MTSVIEDRGVLPLPGSPRVGDLGGMTTTGSKPAVQVRGLRRTYGSYEAVRGVDLDVSQGSITALLGTNGAGKTATLEGVEGLGPAAAGGVSVLGGAPEAD